MTFPDGRIKDGYFDKNIFKGSIQVKDGSDADINTRNSQLGEEEEEKKSVREPKELLIKTRGNSNSLNRKRSQNLSPVITEKKSPDSPISIQLSNQKIPTRPSILKPV